MIDIFAYALPIIILIFSIIVHEVAHGVVAYIHGDETAYRAGRLTLNPLPHVDIFGSIILPIVSVLSTSFLVGWAKPVPYNPYNLRGKHAELWVASAGIIANMLLAFLTILFYRATLAFHFESALFASSLFLIAWTNVSLGLFNLLPIPPFDGMSILQYLFPRMRHTFSSYTQNPLYMIIALIVAVKVFGFFAPYIKQMVYALFVM